MYGSGVPRRAGLLPQVEQAVENPDGPRLERAALARFPGAMGNRAFAEFAQSRALARQPAPPPAAPASSAVAQLSSWAVLQDDWGILEESRNAVEASELGKSVQLQGQGAPSVEVSDEVRSDMRRTVRHQMMYLLWQRRLPLAQELATTHVSSSRLDVQHKMRQQLGGLLNAIRRGKPDAERYEYPEGAPHRQEVVDAVLAMLQLDAMGAAEAALGGDFDKEHEKAMAALNLSATDQWCGAWAYSQLATAGLSVPKGAPNPLAATGEKASHLDGWFAYRQPLEVLVGESWIPVEQYHTQRGSLRKYQVLPASGPEYEADTKAFEGGASRRKGQLDDLGQLDIQPGDVVVKDLTKGTYADHITICRSYDASTKTLSTLGGNEGATHPVHASADTDLTKNPAPSRVPGKVMKPQDRIYAVGRFSVVDFEIHQYRAAGSGAKK